MGVGIEMQTSDTVDDVAQAFVSARRDRRAMPTYPASLPADLREAYAIQDRSIAMWGDRSIGGWKVGRINAPDDARLGANRLSGPIFVDTIVFAAGGDGGEMATFPGGFAAAEGEFMLRLAPQDRPLPQTDADTLAWVDAVRVGIEIASSPYPGINADGPCVTVSDHGNNAGLVLGADVPRAMWECLTDIEVASFVGGTCVGRKTAATMLDGPLGAVRFLLANLAARGIAVTPGTWVSSGAVTGVHEIAPGQTFRAEFAGVGAVECTIAK